MLDRYMQDVPEYHNTLFMEGYTPAQILNAGRQSLYDEAKEGQESDLPNVKITMEVIKK